MPNALNGLKRFASFRSRAKPKPSSSSEPAAGGESCTAPEKESVKGEQGENEVVVTAVVCSSTSSSSAVSRKRSPNTRVLSSSGDNSESGESKRPFSTSSNNKGECGAAAAAPSETEAAAPHNIMETDACATTTTTTTIPEAGMVSTSSSSTSGYSSSTRSSNANKKPPHLTRGSSRSAENNGNNGKENRVPSQLLASHHHQQSRGDQSPLPVIKNRPQRSFVGYVSPYEQFLRFTETDPKYRSEKSQGKILGLYKFCGEIGSGNFSKVKLGIHQLTKERVAIKIIEKSRVQEKMERMLSREVRSMEVLNHPNLIRLYEVMETGTKIYLISEWAPAGDLYSKVTLRGKLPEYDAKPIFRQILAALLYMHGNGIIHRDLKAENVFFSTATVCKVGDFGFSTTGYKGQLLSTFCGSPPYAAPELYRDEAYEGGPVDAWALGVLLYFMTEGRLPFIGTSIPNLKRNILNGEYMMSGNLSDELMDLIQKILQQRPSRRLTVAEMIIHPWLTPESQGSQIFSVNSSTESNSSGAGDSSLGSMDGDSLCSNTSTRQNHCSIVRRDTNGKLFPTTKNRAICRSIPTKEQIIYKLVSQKEIQAYEILHDIGIPETMIEAHRPRGVRSYVIGIYRMLLHKLEKGDEIDFAKFCSHNMTGSVTNFGSAGGHHEIMNSGQHYEPQTPPHHSHHPPATGTPVVNKGPVKMNTNNSPVRYKDEGGGGGSRVEESKGDAGSKVEEIVGPKGESLKLPGGVAELAELGLDELRKSQLRSSKFSQGSQHAGEEVEQVVNNCQAVPSTTCTIL